MRVDWCVSSWFRIKNTHSLTPKQTHDDAQLCNPAPLSVRLHPPRVPCDLLRPDLRRLGKRFSHAVRAEPPQHAPLTCVPHARPRRFPLNRPRPALSSRFSAATASDAHCAVVVALMRRPRASLLRLCQPPASRILRLHRPPACSPRSSASTAAVAMALTLRARLRPCVTH